MNSERRGVPAHAESFRAPATLEQDLVNAQGRRGQELQYSPVDRRPPRMNDDEAEEAPNVGGLSARLASAKRRGKHSGWEGRDMGPSA